MKKLSSVFMLRLYIIFMNKMNLKKILVPLDGSNNSFRGLDHAISLAKLSGASIVGAHVSYVPGNLANPRQGFINQALLKDAKRYLNTAKKRCTDNNVTFTSKVLAGTPSHGIVKFGQEVRNGINMIVMGTRGLSSAKESFLGSVSNHVVHKSKIPVLLVK
jgi:nucleotide-binding universal stress UspA family protein